MMKNIKFHITDLKRVYYAKMGMRCEDKVQKCLDKGQFAKAKRLQERRGKYLVKEIDAAYEEMAL